jgi:ribokinase
MPGGKGANQAAAVGKLGGKPRFVSKVGSDSFGLQILHELGVFGVDTGSVIVDPEETTGVALITVNDSGQNSIVVVPGANARLTGEEVREAVEEIQPGVVLAQLEIPLATVENLAAILAKDAIFILNPAPAPLEPLSADLLSRVDFLTPNQSETEILTGTYPTNDETCMSAAAILFDKGVRNVLITLGDQGSYLANPMFGQYFPALSVTPVDTTAAGDAFNGAFAFFLSQGHDAANCVSLANVVGALSTQKNGAMASMPTLHELRRVASDLL